MALRISETPTRNQNDMNRIEKDQYRMQIVWRNVVIFAVLHIFALYGLFRGLSGKFCWQTIVWAIFCTYFLGLGITAGAHRLWSHKSYKAKLPLRIILAFCQTASVQNSIYEWARDHRVHHKFTDTDADPHNSKRGFFFSHMGWLLVKKHRDVMDKGKTIDLSDLETDSVVMFQRNHYYTCIILTTSFLIWIPWFFWGETLFSSILAHNIRYLHSLHCTWFINSVAHIWGMKPYDKNISAVNQVITSHLTLGEGWHNYHHVFPWDYKVDEFGKYSTNFSTGILDLMAKIGWAYDLKTVPKEQIVKRMLRTGDGTGKPKKDLERNGHYDKNVQSCDKKACEVLCINKSTNKYLQ